MDPKTQKQLFVGGAVVVLAGLGYWWYTRKPAEKKNALPAVPPMGETYTPTSSLPAGEGPTPSPASPPSGDPAVTADDCLPGETILACTVRKIREQEQAAADARLSASMRYAPNLQSANLPYGPIVPN